MTQSNPAPQPPVFRDRIDAAAQLAVRIRPFVEANAPDDVVMVGLARGGVILAAEIARLLGLRHEALVVRKIGAPDQPELAIGAITASGDRVINTHLVEDMMLTDDEVDHLAGQAHSSGLRLAEELGISPRIPGIAGKIAILVDDGLATGATMRVSVASAYGQNAAKVIVAVPVAPTSMLKPFAEISDGMVTVVATDHLVAVGQWYQVFNEVTSRTVREVLHKPGPA